MNTAASGPQGVLVLHPSPLRSIGMAVSSAVIAFLSFRFWLNGLEYGWVAGSFLSIGTVFYLMHLVPGAYALTLSRDGLEIKELYTTKRFAWPEVSEFVVRRGILGTNVEFHHQPAGAPQPRRERLNESFGYKSSKMVELMNEWRARAARTRSEPKRNIWRARKQ